MSDDKQPSLFSVVTGVLRNGILKGAEVTDEVLDATLYVAKTANNTARYGYASNTVWVAQGMSDFTAEERAYIQMMDEEFKLPPVAEEKKDPAVIEGTVETKTD